MAESLTSMATLTEDSVFRGRVRAAVFEAAFEVLSEDPDEVDGWPQRGALAGRALTRQDETTTLFVGPVAVDEEIAGEFAKNADQKSVTDEAIRGRVREVWNQIAGTAQRDA